MSPKQREKCAACGNELDPQGNCPNSCTESIDYGVAEGSEWDEKDLLKESLRTGICQLCESKMKEGRCPLGCFKEI